MRALRSCGHEPCLALLASALLGLFIFVGCGGPPGASQEEGATTSQAVQVVTVQARDLEVWRPYAGVLEPVRASDLPALTSGEVQRVLAELGDAVVSGQLLAEADPSKAALQRDQALADLRSAEASHAQAGAALRREEQLHQAGDISDAQLDAAVHQEATASARVEAARAALGMARLGLRDCGIRAPFAGVVTDRLVKQGQRVSPGTLAFRVADMRVLEARLAVGSAAAVFLRPGDPARLLGPLNGRPGEVLAVGREADGSSGQFPVLVRFENADGALLGGMSVEVELRVARHEAAMAVPSEAVVERSGRDVVFAVQHGLALSVPVEVGETVGEQVLVRGLEPGAQVVRRGAFNCSEGVPVEIVADGAAEGEP